jgi:hypothetical protein
VEAIAAHDVLLLVWSRYAAASDFVECEWNIAVALQKRVLPCLLDDTPLPPALCAIQCIDMRVVKDALPDILQALARAQASTDPQLTRGILTKLAKITPAEPENVVRALKQPADKPKKRVMQQWQTWVGTLAALLTILTFIMQFYGHGIIPHLPFKQTKQTLSGVIRDETGQGLSGVEVVLPEFELKDTTDENGSFTFRVKAPTQHAVKLIARKAGYITRNENPILGNPSYDFMMEREK